MESRARRVFISAWVVLGLIGALDHTIAEKILGRRLDLVLPHLKYGYVMFNVNPRKAQVYAYSRADGVRHDLADLVAIPAPGYPRARLAVDLLVKPDYLREVCFRATRASREEYDFFVDEYEMDVEPRTPAHTATLHCDAHGLFAR